MPGIPLVISVGGHTKPLIDKTNLSSGAGKIFIAYPDRGCRAEILFRGLKILKEMEMAADRKLMQALVRVSRPRCPTGM